METGLRTQLRVYTTLNADKSRNYRITLNNNGVVSYTGPLNLEDLSIKPQSYLIGSGEAELVKEKGPQLGIALLEEDLLYRDELDVAKLFERGDNVGLYKLGNFQTPHLEERVIGVETMTAEVYLSVMKQAQEAKDFHTVRKRRVNVHNLITDTFNHYHPDVGAQDL